MITAPGIRMFETNFLKPVQCFYFTGSSDENLMTLSMASCLLDNQEIVKDICYPQKQVQVVDYNISQWYCTELWRVTHIKLLSRLAAICTFFSLVPKKESLVAIYTPFAHAQLLQDFGSLESCMKSGPIPSVMYADFSSAVPLQELSSGFSAGKQKLTKHCGAGMTDLTFPLRFTNCLKQSNADCCRQSDVVPDFKIAHTVCVSQTVY